MLGLDGVPYSLLVDYMDRGIMPELKELCQSGKLYKMYSTLPEISSVSWSSFITGKNPGEHGIFGFIEIDPQSYGYVFPNFSSLKERPFWERQNIKTVAFNIPQTYPARPTSGVLVSGFVALDLKKATFPERVYEYLKKIDYKLDVNSKLAAENPEAFFLNLFDTFEKRKKAIKYLYENEDWQLFIGTITETDRLQHFFIDCAAEGKYFPKFERFYREIDSLIGQLARAAQKDGAVFLTCSDHGFTVIKTEVYLNNWLIEQGFLHLKGGNGLKGIESASRAFCLDPSRIYIHSQGKYSRGSVPSGEKLPLINEIKEKIKDLTFEGEQVINRVYTQDEIFQGKYASEGPDLYLLPHYGFDLKGRIDSSSIFGKTHLTGMHTYDDAHFFTSSPISLTSSLVISDLAGILLDYLS